MLNLKQSKELICFFIKYPLVWFCTQDAPSSGACTTPHGSVVLQISSFQAVYQSGTSFSAGGETKISWLFSKTEQGLGCCSPPGMSRWLLGYSHHGRPGSCKPTGCPGRSGCNPCPPTPHWPLTVWNILPSTDLHCYDYPRRHYRTRAAVPRCQPPPPIDQTTVYQNHQLGTGGSILNITTPWLASKEYQKS